MRKVILLLAFLLLLPLAAAQRTVVDGEIYEKYSNGRFGFSVNYPVGYLVPGPEPTNGDGLSFTSPDGRASLVVYGSHFAFYGGQALSYGETDIDDYYQARLKELPDPTYHVLRREQGWFVISGYDENTVYYEKIFNNELCINAVLELRFPEDQRDTYEPLVTEISHSFTCFGGFDRPQ